MYVERCHLCLSTHIKIRVCSVTGHAAHRPLFCILSLKTHSKYDKTIFYTLFYNLGVSFCSMCLKLLLLHIKTF